MKFIICAIVAFLAVVYVYSYIKHKKRKGKNIDTVTDFRKKYLKEINSYKKANGRLDYIERESLIDETQKMKEAENRNTFPNS